MLEVKIYINIFIYPCGCGYGLIKFNKPFFFFFSSIMLYWQMLLLLGLYWENSPGARGK